MTELPDGNMFVCMGASNRIFIINKEKQVLFNALVEQWDEVQRAWQPFPQYRAAPVSLADIDMMARQVAANRHVKSQ